MTTEEIKKGTAIRVEVMRPDGTSSQHLGEFVGCSMSEIVLIRHSWVARTGRMGLFLAGERTSDFEVEISVPDVLTRLPRWGSLVQDWPHPLPTESV